ncbi:MAG: restriction endonuclease subunit S [Sedimenticola sp.]|nr:MAG: restriction endonuclease subunit S [Sedimenticola sp.]
MTAVHTIPSGWKRLSLDQVAHIQTGVAKGKKNVVDPVDVPYLRVANVQDGHLDLSEVKTITIARKDLSKYTLQVGDVLMTEGGDFDKLGRGFVWEGQIENCLHQNHVFAVRTDKAKLHPYFLTYQAGSNYGKGYFLNCSKQSTNLASINSSQLKEYPVLLPGISEQNAIVTKLRTWDRAILLFEKLISEKQLVRMGLMQQLLTGNKRLPGFENTWSEVALGELFNPVRRKNTNGETLVLTASGEHGLVDQAQYFNRNVAGQDLSGYFKLSRGDFAYNRSSMNGYPFGAIKRLDQHDSGVVSTLYICFTPSSNICFTDFYMHLFESGILNRQLRGIVQVGARAHGLLNVGIHDFFTLKVPCPPIEEQQQIAKVINSANKELDLLHSQADSLREQKKGLMQQLLTGKIRVGSGCGQ